jgi:reverse gyrase
MLKAVYEGLCSGCGGDLSVAEAEKGICSLKERPLCLAREEALVEEFLRFFEEIIGKPRALQRLWARRVLRGESFAAVAPTGVGKTSFGAAIALFLASYDKKSYILLPTTLLVNQVVDSLKNYTDKAGFSAYFNSKGEGIGVLYYHSALKKDERERFFELLSQERYSILVTTTSFLARRFDLLKGRSFNFIFVDDVDAVLKGSRNVERLLLLLGFYREGKRWKGKAKGALMVSTATAKPGAKTRLFRELLGFDVGATSYALRNVEDFATSDESIEVIKGILTRLGAGGLIFARNASEAERLYEALRESFKVGIVAAGDKKDFEAFERGELEHLIGTSYYYGTLVRGLDLPEQIRYAIFVGAPALRLRISEMAEASPGMLRALALIFRNHEEIRELLPKLSTLERDVELQKRLREVLGRLIKEGKTEEKDVVVREGEVILPDVRTYIQGSGRTSRLFAGGLTKGASFLLENDKALLNAFIQRASYYDIEFKSLEEVDFDRLAREIDESRAQYKRRAKLSEMITPALFIVESPTKARQISRFFGKPSVRVLRRGEEAELIAYEVPTSTRVLLITACLGHVVDLVTDRGFHGVELNSSFVPVYASIKRCRNCGYQFTFPVEACPKCGSVAIDDASRRVEALRKLAKDAGEVIIGTDPDAEGEKIAWDLANLLAGCGRVKRAEFHEVTRRAVSEALSNLRDIDERLVKAQIVRRIEDRWIGFTLSQKLWQVFSRTNLSAGRAQTPVLGWVIRRAEEHKQKRCVAVIKELGLSLEGVAREELELEISLIEEKEEERTPLPPYTTDTLLRDAHAILKIPAKDAMKLAQELFESGLITYHRTDSTRVSDVGLRLAREFLGEDFAGREWHAEGAHECIRPTRAVPKETLQRLISEGVVYAEALTWRHLALYDLIFRRFMASQAKPFVAKVARYRVAWNEGSIEEERILEAMGRAAELYRWAAPVRKALPLGRIRARAKVLLLPKAKLLTQAEIIQLMKARGIGRPSTYAAILDRLFLRRYVVERNGRVLPTRLGKEVFTYLSRRYGNFVSEERTKLLEEKMDAIERGEMDYEEALRELYEEIRGIGG